MSYIISREHTIFLCSWFCFVLLKHSKERPWDPLPEVSTIRPQSTLLSKYHGSTLTSCAAGWCWNNKSSAILRGSKMISPNTLTGLHEEDEWEKWGRQYILCVNIHIHIYTFFFQELPFYNMCFGCTHFLYGNSWLNTVGLQCTTNLESHIRVWKKAGS